MELVEKKWDDILLRVKEEHELTDVSFNTWLKPLKIHSIQNNRLYILVPSEHEQMGLSYITKRYYLPIKVAAAEITEIEYEIEFILPDQAKKIAPPRIKKTPTTEEAERSNLNPNYTFNTFVVGGNNRFAHSASLAVAETPGEVYNPLFIYGGVGLGKTHLMHSIAHFIQSNNPNMKVLYVSSETFTNELIDAIRNEKSNKALINFREKYRNIDVLLIDDVQFIIGKESTQEEFFHTFNELHVAKKQIVISSDKPPKEMETLEERIRSRFEWGLIADIGSPDYETRMAILRKKEEAEGYKLDDEILNYIAINIKSNIRELEGALNKLLAFSRMENKEITMEIAVRELQSIISPDKPREVTAQLILEVVSEHFGITVDQIMSKSRSNDVAKPRQIAMYLCKQLTELTHDSIGQLLGGRDHSTVIHGIKKVSDECSSDKNFKQTLETVRKKINPY